MHVKKHLKDSFKTSVNLQNFHQLSERKKCKPKIKDMNNTDCVLTIKHKDIRSRFTNTATIKNFSHGETFQI